VYKKHTSGIENKAKMSRLKINIINKLKQQSNDYIKLVPITTLTKRPSDVSHCIQFNGRSTIGIKFKRLTINLAHANGMVTRVGMIPLCFK